MRLAAQGPPVEEVGLAPFPPPSTVSLPLPTYKPSMKEAKA
jgi:hypothetical protein